MSYRRDSTEEAARRKARHARDDASPRLRDRVPRLEALHFEISVSREGVAVEAARHVKRFVVGQAPALFVLDCTDQSCRDGGHDLTERVLGQLAANQERFEAEDSCRGRSGDRECGRVVRVTAFATYARAERGTR